MENDQWVALDEFCSIYQVEYSFLDSLNNSGLISLFIREEKKYLPEHQIPELERFIRLHYDLDINIEGIEAISNLLKRVAELQKENNLLKSKFQLTKHERQVFNL